IFLCAVIVRFSYLSGIESFPLFHHLAVDSESYDQWAQQITAGDWLSRRLGVFYQAPLFPYFLSLLHVLFGNDLWWIRLVQLTLGALSCSLLYVAGTWWFGRAAGIAAGLIFSLYAPAVFYDALIQKTILDLLWITVLLLLMARAATRPHWSTWVVMGAILG